MEKAGYIRLASNYCVYVRRFLGDDFIILLLYVDDILILGKDPNRIYVLKDELGMNFDMKNLGPIR